MEVGENYWSLYPLTIVRDRYGGVYSGGRYLAFNMDVYEVERIPFDDGDLPCFEYWENEGKNILVGKGNTPNKALDNLLEQLKEASKD